MDENNSTTKSWLEGDRYALKGEQGEAAKYTKLSESSESLSNGEVVLNQIQDDING